MRILRSKTYKLRQVGVRGVIAQVPKSFQEAYLLQAGDEYFAVEDERGNLMFVFPHSKDYPELAEKLGVKK